MTSVSFHQLGDTFSIPGDSSVSMAAKISIDWRKNVQHNNEQNNHNQVIHTGLFLMNGKLQTALRAT